LNSVFSHYLWRVTRCALIPDTLDCELYRHSTETRTNG